jgi:hypothetical protein
VRRIISTQHERRKCSAAFVAALVYRTALMAINPSECYAITNFLERDFGAGIASECAVNRELTDRQIYGKPTVQVLAGCGETWQYSEPQGAVDSTPKGR